MANWQRLVDELQRVNRLNQEAMLTMDNDKSEWDKVLKEKDEEISNVAAHNDELQKRIKDLEDQIASSSNSHKQREKILQNQVKDAHAAQVATEGKLLVEQQLADTFKKDVTQLREKVAAQNTEISSLQSKLAPFEQERD